MRYTFWFRKKTRRRRRKLPRLSSAFKKVARIYFDERVAYFAKRYGFSYGRIALRQQRTRWGSCSSKKNLNFNLGLMVLREELRDYVIVHELAHTRHMNHGASFWQEVESIIPHYRELRRELKRIPLAQLHRTTRHHLKTSTEWSTIRVISYAEEGGNRAIRK